MRRLENDAKVQGQYPTAVPEDVRQEHEYGWEKQYAVQEKMED